MFNPAISILYIVSLVFIVPISDNRAQKSDDPSARTYKDAAFLCVNTSNFLSLFGSLLHVSGYNWPDFIFIDVLGIHTRFVVNGFSQQPFGSLDNYQYRWKQCYRPPWGFILHLLEIGVVIWLFTKAVAPSVHHLYDVRQMLASILYPDTTDEPYESIDAIREGIEGALDNLEAISKGSFQYFYFLNMSDPVYFLIGYKNGTTVKSTFIDVTRDLCVHVTFFELVSDFMLVSPAGELTGCTKWHFSYQIALNKGSYLFSLTPSLVRDWCPDSAIAQSDATKTRRLSRVLTDEPSMPRNRSQPLSFRLSPLVMDNSYLTLFSRHDLTLYAPIVRMGLFLLICAGIHTVSIAMTLGKRFVFHKQMLTSRAEYNDVEPYEQFHSVIGFWVPLSLVTSVVVFVSGWCFVSDAMRMTQFPSERAVIVFGFAAFLAITTGIRWLQFMPNCYSVVLVIKLSFSRLMAIMIGCAPIVMGMMFVGLFLFGRAATVSESMVSLFEIILSVTFGDVILDVYGMFTDGSAEYNLLSFIYVSIIVAVSMWMFFTAFTAHMVDIYRTKVTTLLKES